MNNNELKKKIVEILKAHIYIDNYGLVHRLDYAEIADALIAEVVRDIVKIAREIGVSATAMAVFEAEKAKHRAEVAERMAKNACSIVFTREIDDKDWAEVICQYKEEHGLFDEVGITDDMLYDYLKEQTEKELAEERKND